jgi:3-oxoacyl-[acyl-carrier protein] reductase
VSKTVLITGAAIGIGRAAARAFSAAGYHVVVTDVLEKEGKALAAEIAAGKGSAEFQRLDVRSTADADAVVAAVEKKHGGIDCVVANAGIAHRSPLSQLTDERWDPYFRYRPQGNLPRGACFRTWDEGTQGGFDCLPLVYYGQHLWLG